jgi:hypothetical protein
MCRIASRVEGGRSYCIGDSRLTMVEWDEGRERAVQPVEGEEPSFCSDYCRLSDARDHSGQRLIKTANEQRREPIVVARPPPPPPLHRSVPTRWLICSSLTNYSGIPARYHRFEDPCLQCVNCSRKNSLAIRRALAGLGWTAWQRRSSHSAESTTAFRPVVLYLDGVMTRKAGLAAWRSNSMVSDIT